MTDTFPFKETITPPSLPRNGSEAESDPGSSLPGFGIGLQADFPRARIAQPPEKKE